MSLRSMPSTAALFNAYAETPIHTRLPLPAGFPALVDLAGDTRYLVEAVHAALKVAGYAEDQLPSRINIAYPHKDPELFPHHDNRASKTVRDTYIRLKDAMPDVDWRVAEDICETRSLMRSKNQDSVYALTMQQIFNQNTLKTNFKTEFNDSVFIVVDHCSEQGTTLANLISFIRRRGGTVLFTAVDDIDFSISRSLVNTHIDELGQVFGASAGIDPSDALDRFDKALRLHGATVDALTDGETLRLIHTVREGRGFIDLVDTLLDSETVDSQLKRLGAVKAACYF